MNDEQINEVVEVIDRLAASTGDPEYSLASAMSDVSVSLDGIARALSEIAEAIREKQ